MSKFIKLLIILLIILILEIIVIYIGHRFYPKTVINYKIHSIDNFSFTV